MLPITEKIIRHYIPDQKKPFTSTIGGKPVLPKPESSLPKGVEVVSVTQIRKSIGFEIKRFRHLVRRIAELAYYNPQYSLLYRGFSKIPEDALILKKGPFHQKLLTITTNSVNGSKHK